MLSDKELIERLRKYADVGHPGQAGFECVVEKPFLTEVADRLEQLSALHILVDDHEPITHFSKTERGINNEQETLFGYNRRNQSAHCSNMG